MLSVHLVTLSLLLPIFLRPSSGQSMGRGLGSMGEEGPPRKQAGCLLPEDTVALELDFTYELECKNEEQTSQTSKLATYSHKPQSEARVSFVFSQKRPHGVRCTQH